MKTHALPCPVPAASAINARLAQAYFYDCYAIAAPGTTRSALGHFLIALANTPRWVNSLMILRNKLVLLVGLKDLGGMANFDVSKPEQAYRPGDRVGIFTLIENSPEEVLLGERDKHLDVVLSVYRKPPDADGKQIVAVTTVVHVHNWLGRLYMLPVKPMHKLIAPAVLSRMVVAK